MMTKNNKQDLEQKQIAHGMCYGMRYNPKLGKTEKCKHREECALHKTYHLEVHVLKRKHTYDVEDYVGNQYIKNWRKCEVWKNTMI